MTITTNSKHFVYNLEGISENKIDVDFGASHKNANYIVHRAYIAQTTQQRQGTHNTKTKAEVRGGGKKPWKQKGTGRARSGSSRSPLWRGGGVIFGPKYQPYKKKINKKEKALALQACLQNRKSNIKIINDFTDSFSKPSTKLILELLGKWEVNIKDKILIITKINSRNLYLSVRNIPNINIILASQLNTQALLLAHTVLISTNSLPMIYNYINKE